MVSDRVAEVINGSGDFNHGYTYSAHPVAAAVALENIRILDDENIIENARDELSPYLAEKWATLEQHPMVGGAKSKGLVASLVLTPHKESRSKFTSEAGTVGFICRERCFENNLVMRHVGDRMIISPPLVISKSEIDLLIDRAWQSIDEAYNTVKAEQLWKAA